MEAEVCVAEVCVEAEVLFTEEYFTPEQRRCRIWRDRDFTPGIGDGMEGWMPYMEG